MHSPYRDYGKRRYGFVAPLLAELREFSLLKSVQTGSAAYKASTPWKPGPVYCGGYKVRPGRETDHSTIPNAKVKYSYRVFDQQMHLFIRS